MTWIWTHFQKLTLLKFCNGHIHMMSSGDTTTASNEKWNSWRKSLKCAQWWFQISQQPMEKDCWSCLALSDTKVICMTYNNSTASACTSQFNMCSRWGLKIPLNLWNYVWNVVFRKFKKFYIAKICATHYILYIDTNACSGLMFIKVDLQNEKGCTVSYG